MRPLYAIANDVYNNWPKVSPYARPYLEAMATLDSVNDMYIEDTGDSVVRYFLGNATGWRGDHARRIKAELKSMIA